MKIILFITIITIITIILLLINICTNDLFQSNNKVYNLYTNVDHYRIGDLLKGYYNSPMKGNDKSLSLKDGILKLHSNTFAAKYIQNNKLNKVNNIELLNNLISKNNNFNNICIVHLRVGDILDDKHYNNSKELILKKFNENIPNDNLNYSSKLLPNWYLKSKNYYLNKINILKNNNINNIIIIAGSHINIGNYELSSYFINLIKNLFEKNNFKVKLRLASHPDDDLTIVANSPFFITSNGSYSDLLKNISILNKNKVL